MRTKKRNDEFYVNIEELNGKKKKCFYFKKKEEKRKFDKIKKI